MRSWLQWTEHTSPRSLFTVSILWSFSFCNVIGSISHSISYLIVCLSPVSLLWEIPSASPTTKALKTEWGWKSESTKILITVTSSWFECCEEHLDVNDRNNKEILLNLNSWVKESFQSFSPIFMEKYFHTCAATWLLETSGFKCGGKGKGKKGVHDLIISPMTQELVSHLLTPVG